MNAKTKALLMMAALVTAAIIIRISTMTMKQNSIVRTTKRGQKMDLETIKKLKDCCAREAALRVNVYPKWVASGRMTQEKADEEIKLMQIAAACFNKILQGNAPPEVQQSLFDTKPYEPKRNNYY